MKRVKHNAHFGVPAGSVRDVFTRSQLAEVGAVVLAWNHLELRLDQSIGYGLELPELIEHEVVGRLHGIDGKIAIVRLLAGRGHLTLSSAVHKRIDSTMSAVTGCKTYRDAVAHARSVNSKVGHIVETSGARGKMFDLLFTPDALSLLAKRIEAVSDEVSDIEMIFTFRAAMFRMWDARTDGSLDQDIRLLGQDVQRYAARLRRHQKRRLSLPPLPAFPQERPTL